MPVEPFLIERFFARHEFTTPHLLGVSDCETLRVEELLALEPGAEEGLRSLRLGYTESEGSPELRQAIAATYTGLNPDDILVHNAAVEVLLTVALAVLRTGDHAVVHHPGYQAQRTAAGIAGARVSLWRARPELAWAPDMEELPRLLARPRTRLLVITSPHNPTGFHFDEATFRTVLRLAEARGVLVLVDEAYRGTEYEAGRKLPSAAEVSPWAGAVGVMSKGLGLPGLRLGWLATRNPALRKAVAEAKDYSSICSVAPAEYLAALGLRHAEQLLDRNRRLICRNLGLLRSVMNAHSDRFDWVPPQAGPVTFPTLRHEDPDDFARRLREEAGVLVVPGTVFDEESRQVRLGFGRASFQQGLERFEAWLAS